MAQAAEALHSSELVLGRYRPLKPLGTGGSGTVWLARDERNGLDVALKIVPREGKAASRAEREASAAARLRHPHCLRAYGFGRDSQHVYIAYEYVPGRTLRDAIRARDLSDADVIEAAAQILDALAHAHAHGIVHRDVKPANVLVAGGPSMSVRLLDFGLARMTQAETLTAAGDVPGTLAYISPERLRGETATPASDVWGVGVLLWEALAGWHPFWTSALLDTARAIELGAAPLETVRPDLPAGLTRAVGRALSPEAGARPTAVALAQLLRGTPLRRPRGRRTGSIAFPAAPIRRVVPALLAALAAAWAAASVPFFPGGAPAVLGAAAALTTFWRPRLGLLVTLAVPVFPLGNISLGLALAYGAAALVWLGVSWREPEAGFLVALGPLLALASALALIPLAVSGVRSPVRRALGAGAGVLIAAAVAGFRHAPLPFTGARPPLGLGVAGSDRPAAVAGAIWRVLATHPAIGIEALVLAAAAAAVPWAREAGIWWIAGLGAALLSAALLPVAAVAAAPFVVAAWITCVALVVTAGR